jgi:hypothetical protein
MERGVHHWFGCGRCCICVRVPPAAGLEGSLTPGGGTQISLIMSRQLWQPPYLSPLLSVVRHLFDLEHSLKVHSRAIPQQTHSIALHLVTTRTVGLMARRIASRTTSKPVLPVSITLTCLALQVRIHMWNVATKDDKLVLSCHWVLNYQWSSWRQTPHDSSVEQSGTCRHAAAWHSRNDLLIISTFATDAQVQIAIFGTPLTAQVYDNLKVFVVQSLSCRSNEDVAVD